MSELQILGLFGFAITDYSYCNFGFLVSFQVIIDDCGFSSDINLPFHHFTCIRVHSFLRARRDGT